MSTAKVYAPDEKSIEVVFAAYAARLAKSIGKTLITYAPSQTLEKDLAYDGKFIGSGCRELYVQFKKSSVHRYGMAFRPSDKEQLEALQKKYPPRSAFYVAASFEDDTDLFASQHSLAEAGFLDRYLAVDATILDKSSNSVRFNQDLLNHKRNIHDFPNHGTGHKKTTIHRPNWLTGCELLCSFLGCDCTDPFASKSTSTKSIIGSRVVVRDGRLVRLPMNVRSNNEDADYDSWSINRSNEPIYIASKEISLLLRVFDS